MWLSFLGARQRSNRDAVELNEDMRKRLTNLYRQIDAWRDVVDSGLHPTIGSMELETLLAEIRSTIPLVIDELRQMLKKFST